MRATARRAGNVFALADTRSHSLQDVVGDGDLLHRVFGKGDTDSVTNAINQQSSDACGTLQATLHGIACLSDTEMDGIVHA